MCPSIPSSVQDAARFSAPCPQKKSTPAARLGTQSSLALALDRRLLNQTILECADWGQITVSYTVLPLRRSSACGRSKPRLARLAAPKKCGQINALTAFPSRRGRRHPSLIAATARNLGEAPQQGEFSKHRISWRLPIHGGPPRLRTGAVAAQH